MDPPSPTGNGSLSYWLDTTPPTSFPPLRHDERADVAIVGGGIVGITAAYLLAKAGRSVVVVDRDRLASEETGHTTAHLQRVVDTRLSDLVPRFGLAGARKAWDSQTEAVRLIESIAADERIRCELERLPAYLYAPDAKDRDMLREEMRLAQRIGYAAEEVDASRMPFPAAAAIRFPEQGKFHVRKYLLGVVDAATRMGVRFYEGSQVVDIEGGTPVRVKTATGPVVTADWLVLATNTPIVGNELVHTVLFPYRTYAIGARVPKGIFEEALFWDTLDPYHYTRIERKTDHDLVIHGGEDHRVGAVEDTEKAWGALLLHLQEATDECTPVYQWSGEVIETQDDLPLIGRVPGRGENELMVAGDSGTGMTNGTIGAMMVTERILGRGTPWDEMYDPTRFTFGAGAARQWAKENLRVGATLAKRAVMRSEIEDIAELSPGEGAILKRGLKPVAVSRLTDGTLHACSAVCTHMGCTVKWNSGETSWDCGCHGSRFAPDGAVLHGPAMKPLAPVSLDEIIEDRQRRSGEAARRT